MKLFNCLFYGIFNNSNFIINSNKVKMDKIINVPTYILDIYFISTNRRDV